MNNLYFIPLRTHYSYDFSLLILKLSSFTSFLFACGRNFPYFYFYHKTLSTQSNANCCLLILFSRSQTEMKICNRAKVRTRTMGADSNYLSLKRKVLAETAGAFSAKMEKAQSGHCLGSLGCWLKGKLTTQTRKYRARCGLLCRSPGSHPACHKYSIKSHLM